MWSSSYSGKPVSGVGPDVCGAPAAVDIRVEALPQGIDDVIVGVNLLAVLKPQCVRLEWSIYCSVWCRWTMFLEYHLLLST